MATIEINKLRKEYKDVVAVDDLTLAIEEGELFALLGVNGAGKSTLVKMLATLTKPTSGDALVCGRSVVKEPDEVKECVDVSMQETAVARKLTVEENITFYAALNGDGKEAIRKKRDELNAAFGFSPVLAKKASKLSGGWQRKLSIALALLSDPEVLFLDEPTLGLDVIARRELWEIVREMKGKRTIILTTHYMEEAEALADRIGVMKDGKLLFVGTKEEMYALTSKSSVEEAFIEIVTGGASRA